MELPQCGETAPNFGVTEERHRTPFGSGIDRILFHISKFIFYLHIILRSLHLRSANANLLDRLKKTVLYCRTDQ